MLQDVFFIFDTAQSTRNNAVWFFIRNYLYDLRKYSFEKNVDLRIAFSTLEKNTSNSVSFFDLNTFSVNENSVDSYFFNQGFDSLNYYFSSCPNQNTNQSIILFFYDTKIQNEENYNRLNSLNPFAKSKRSIFDSVNLQKSDVAISSSATTDFFQKIKNIQPSKKIMQVAALVCALFVLGGLLYVLIASGVFKSYKYAKVYTGDGDRVILRASASRDANEIMRINENETVRILNVLGEWSEAEYHGFNGYLFNKYLVSGEKNEYDITAPYAMYDYAKACLKYHKTSLGKEYLLKSVNENCISAQYEMALLSDSNSVEKQKWFERICGTVSCVEDSLINSYKVILKECKNSETQRIKTLKNNIAMKEENIKLIRKLSAKKLSEEYFGKDDRSASSYYKKALAYGLDGDSDYMYELGKNINSESEKIEWFKKASNKGHVESKLELGRYYYKNKKYDSTLTYYRNINKAEAYYYCGKIYYDRREYYFARSYFQYAVGMSDYSYEWYLANYALGLCYEYGYGFGYVDKRSALKYYDAARLRVAEASTAYNRVYNEVYYTW